MKLIDKSVFIADGAKIVGDVEIGKNSSVWFNAVIRADSDKVKIGENSNVQDNSVIHTSEGFGVQIGDNVTIGHGAIIHGCTVKDNVMIGMGAIVLNGAVIEENSIIGAGALITQGKVIPAGSLAFGNPCKIVRQLTDEEISSISCNAKSYVKEAEKYNTKISIDI
ncbi:MAG: gamma carbonic anhydrase family protein [Clostridia bacterium]|nr:gamma carbonic anhydrase family protein [Clostridia bacterium]